MEASILEWQINERKANFKAHLTGLSDAASLGPSFCL